MRIAIIDTSTTRAAIISDGLREAGLVDLAIIDPSGPLMAQVEAAQPEVVLINLENPSRDQLEDFFAVSRALARPIAMFVDQSDAEATGAAIDAGVSAYVVDGLSKQRIKPTAVAARHSTSTGLRSLARDRPSPSTWAATQLARSCAA